MDLSLIGRTLKTTGLISLLVLVFGSFYYGFQPTLSVFTGIVWGMINLYFLALLIRATLKPGEIDKQSALIILLIKFPLLYISGYFIVTSEYFNPLLFLAGFTVILLVIVLKAFGRTILKLDNVNMNNKQESIKSV
jgi:hypothetical protein